MPVDIRSTDMLAASFSSSCCVGIDEFLRVFLILFFDYSRFIINKKKKFVQLDMCCSRMIIIVVVLV
jgi:hypothetical protein